MAQTLELRPYQAQSVDELSVGWRMGLRRQLLVAPTGAGKTVIATDMIHRAIGRGTRIAMILDRVTLVDQTSAMLDAYGIDHGVIQADHWRWHPELPMQVCSAQTLERRQLAAEFDLLIIDEAHAVRAAVNKMILEGKARTVGLTATPFTTGLGEIYQRVVNVTTTNKLVDEGFLTPVKIYAATAPDMSGAKIIAGEWSEKDIEQRGTAIIGDIVAEWKEKTLKHFDGPVKTIVFSASIAHGQEICRQFQEQGFNFVQISAYDDQDKRRSIIEEYRRPDSSIVGIVSCEVLSRGFDVPDVLCGISARPYRKSFSAHIQQIGRVMRTAPGKNFALWLDHSGNILRFWDDQCELFDTGVPELAAAELDKKARKEPDENEKAQRRCPVCKFVLPPRADHCPSCGKAMERKALVETQNGKLVELGGDRAKKQLPEYLRDRESVWRQIAALAIEATNGDMERAQRRAQAQFKDLYGDWHYGKVANTKPLEPSVQLQMKVRSLQRKFHKIRQAKDRMRSKAA